MRMIILNHAFSFHIHGGHYFVGRHYDKAANEFYTNIIRAPALFLVSKSDFIGTEASNLLRRAKWEKLGIKVRLCESLFKNTVVEFVGIPLKYLFLFRFTGNVGTIRHM